MSAPSPKPTRPRSTRIKRSASPASAAAVTKRKRSPPEDLKPGAVVAETTTSKVEAPATPAAPEVQTPSAASSTVPPIPDVPPVPQRPVLPFKDPTFTHSSKGLAASKKSRVWKTLKQITSAERAFPWKPDEATYSSIDAPPSLKPTKRYSDLSGFPAKYTDPQTKLRFTDTEEFSRTRMLPTDIVTGLLSLRKANPELQ